MPTPPTPNNDAFYLRYGTHKVDGVFVTLEASGKEAVDFLIESVSHKSVLAPNEADLDKISPCKSCYCMTHTMIDGKCGKCKAPKFNADTNVGINEAEDAEREELRNTIDKLREKFEIGLVAAGIDATNVDYEELAAYRSSFRKDLIELFKSQRHKLLAEIEGKLPKKYTNSQVFNSREFYGYNKALNEVDAAWRAMLKGYGK